MDAMIKGSAIDPVATGGGVCRKVLAHDADMMLVEVSFETGSIGAVHTHPHKQISYVVSGKYEYYWGEESFLLEQGDSILVPPGLPHGTKCLAAGLLLDCFTPQRDDFL